jgi:hypothetical protein
MVTLISIHGIGKASHELLEAAGFHDVESLAKADVSELARELALANAIFKICKRRPGRAVIAKWIAAARDKLGVSEQSAGPAEPALMPVNYEQSPQVIAMLVNAPFAIPLPTRVLVDHELGVVDIPAAILLNHCSGDLDVKVEQRSEMNWQSKPVIPPGNCARVGDNGNSRLGVDILRIRSTENMVVPMLRVAEVKTAPKDDRVALLRAPRVSTNKGRDPHSRWYIRGVLHSHPLSILVGALVTLLLIMVIPAFVISGALLLASGEIPEYFAWVPKWLLVFPVVLPVAGLIYLIFGFSASCRICGQKLFVHRPHLKNSRAHHVKGLGYILPLCLHLLLFRWFRCTHCGTPVRLKE